MKTLTIVSDSAQHPEASAYPDNQDRDVIIKDSLVTAIKQGDTSRVSQMLSDGGVNPNTCYELADRGGLSPLMITCMHGQHVIAELLLEHDAKVNLQDSLGWSALMHAIKPGHLAVAQLLLRHGADVDLQSTKWESALSLALHQEDPDMVTVIDEKVSSLMNMK